MLKVADTKLVYNDVSIKSQVGVATDNVLSLVPAKTQLNVGGLEFPLISLNKITFDPDGSLAVIDKYLTVAYKNILYTPEIIVVSVDKTSSPDQLTTFVVQHGETARVLSNFVEQDTQLLFIDGQPLTVSATNNLTGATTSQTVTPVRGQHYKLVAVSETLHTGELKTICVQEEYDFVNSPMAPFDKDLDKVIGTFDTTSSVYRYQRNFVYNGSAQTAYNYARTQWGVEALMTVYDYPLTEYGDFQAIPTWLNNTFQLEYGYPVHPAFYPLYDQPDVGGHRDDLALNNPELGSIKSGDLFSPPVIDGDVTPKIYSFSKPGITPNQFMDRAFLDILDQSAVVIQNDVLPIVETEVVVTLIPGKIYKLNSTSTYVDKIRETFSAGASNNGSDWVYEVYVDRNYTIQLSVQGPLEKVCVATDVIDTRKTTHTIALDLVLVN